MSFGGRFEYSEGTGKDGSLLSSWSLLGTAQTKPEASPILPLAGLLLKVNDGPEVEGGREQEWERTNNTSPYYGASLPGLPLFRCHRLLVITFLEVVRNFVSYQDSRKEACCTISKTLLHMSDSKDVGKSCLQPCRCTQEIRLNLQIAQEAVI